MDSRNFLEQWRDVGRSLNHSSFNLTHNRVYSLPASLLAPVLCLETVPNEHHRINLGGLLRTDTLNKAAFANSRIYVNLFFVPYKQLWHNFNDLISQKSDPHSTTYKGSAYAPNVKLRDLVSCLCAAHFGHVKDVMGYEFAYNGFRLLHYLKYGDYRRVLQLDSFNPDTYTAWIDEHIPDNTYVNVFRFLAYQHIFYDYYRNKYYDDTPFVHSGTSTVDESLLPQYIDSFNVDDIDCKTVGSSHLPYSSAFNSPYVYRLCSMLAMHYHQYKKDIYNSALPSMQFGAVSSLSLKDIEINTNTSAGPNDVGVQGVYLDGSNVNKKSLAAIWGGTENDRSVMWNLPNAVDVLALRKAELMQAWKQNALRAGNMVDDNFRSHYGVEPYYEEDNNVRFLGSWQCHLDINPVTATAASGDAINGQVGDLAAIGVGQFTGHEVSFESKDFGVLMAIASFVPDVYYNASGIDKANTLIEPFDFFYPEFQNVGFESLPIWQQSVSLPKPGNQSAVHPRDFWNFNLGFVPPQSMYKTSVDEAFGDFGLDGTMSEWLVKRDDTANLFYKNIAGPFDPTKMEAYYLRRKSLYIDPHIVNPLFGVEYDGTYVTDIFSLAVNWSINSIRPMSVLGLPQFT